MKKINLKGLTVPELEEFALSVGEKKFRGRQLYDWLYMRDASTLAEMSSLSKSLRDKIGKLSTIGEIKIVKVTKSADGTRKFLFELEDGKKIESVLIPPRTAFMSPDAKDEEEQKRLTLCVSTQVGCPLGCRFCATGEMGFSRNLTAGEIVDQVQQVRRYAGERITNLVYMGMGEPLLNYDSVMNSAEIMTTGMRIATRRITVSTAGLAPQIRRIADENRKVKLAVSLHSLDEPTRIRLMPVAKKYPTDVLIDSLAYYYKKMKRRPTFEYILFDGINDRDDDIRRLVALSKRIPCKVNIIPFHAFGTAGRGAGPAGGLRPTPEERSVEFVRRLRAGNLTVFVRSSAGEDINAACGQLAQRNS